MNLCLCSPHNRFNFEHSIIVGWPYIYASTVKALIDET